MRKYCVLFILIISCLSLQSQTRRFYCEIKGFEKAITSGLNIVFDFGDHETSAVWGGDTKSKFINENGKEIKFNRMVDAANYMAEKGWTFQQAYSSTNSGIPVIHWIFYKDASNFDEARKGIITQEEYKTLLKQTTPN